MNNVDLDLTWRAHIRRLPHHYFTTVTLENSDGVIISIGIRDVQRAFRAAQEETEESQSTSQPELGVDTE